MRPDGRSSQPTSPARTATSNGATSPDTRFTNGHSNGKTEGNGAVSPRRSQNGVAVAETMSPLWYGHNREEVTRILIQSLSDMGYHSAARQLSRESGFELEGPTVAAFRSAVLAGEWAEAEALLFGISTYDGGGGGADVGSGNGVRREVSGLGKDVVRYNGLSKGLTLAEGANKNEMLFWMRQQKYLELLEKRDLGAALVVLRQELTPLHQDPWRLHALSSLMMCGSRDDLMIQAQWDGAHGESRNKLLSELSRSISPSIMIPEHRLAILLDQVKQNWTDNCLYHNTGVSPSLYVDHHCDREDFPLHTQLELHDHTDEVWYLGFSPNGKYLATAGKDASVFIYEVGTTLRRVRSLDHGDAGVCYLAWSPDNKKLITCTRDPKCDCRVWDVESGGEIFTIHDFQYPVTTAAWTPNSENFIIGSQDHLQGLCLFSTDQELLHKWRDDKLRVYDLALSRDGRVLVVLLESRILVYDFPTKEKIGDYEIEGVRMTSVNISRDCQTMLLSMNANLCRTMDIETGEVLQEFTGHKQTENMIRSAFGGADEGFVVSGSEDSRIFIWRTTGHLVETLDCHGPGCVNAVAWNPVDQRVFASAGDDMRVRIWTTADHPLALEQRQRAQSGYRY